MAVQRYTQTEAGKLSISGGILLKGSQELYATSELIDQANIELRRAGTHGSLISLTKGKFITQADKRLHAVIPTLDAAAHRRMADANAVGYHDPLTGPLTTEEVKAQAVLDEWHAGKIPKKTAIERLASLGIKADAISEDTRTIVPGQQMALWADCARASAAVTGSTHTTHGDRVVRISTDGQTKQMVGYLPAHAHDPSAENPAASLANRVYLENIYPFLSKYTLGKSIGDSAFFVQLEKLVERKHYTKQPSKDGETIQFVDPRPASNVMLAKEMYTALTKDGRSLFDQEAGINQYARPEIGEAYTIATEYTMPHFRPRKKQDKEVTPWAFHWGGVILKDPHEHLPDMVTLENFSVSDKEVTNRDWKFEMYGSLFGQTFHELHMETNLHGTKATTMAVATRAPQPQQNLQSPARAAANVSPSRSQTTVQTPQSTSRPTQQPVNNSSSRALPSVNTSPSQTTVQSPQSTTRPTQQPVNNSSARSLPNVSPSRSQTTVQTPQSTSRPTQQPVNNSSSRPLPSVNASPSQTTVQSPQSTTRPTQQPVNNSSARALPNVSPSRSQTTVQSPQNTTRPTQQPVNNSSARALPNPSTSTPSRVIATPFANANPDELARTRLRSTNGL